jgi:hypothetical protein
LTERPGGRNHTARRGTVLVEKRADGTMNALMMGACFDLLLRSARQRLLTAVSYPLSFILHPFQYCLPPGSRWQLPGLLAR